MTHEDAWRILYNCMVNSIQKHTTETKDKSSQQYTFPYIYPRNDDEACDYLDKIYNIYRDELVDGCANGIGYVINIEEFSDFHPVYCLVTVYSLLVADADMYFIYDEFDFDGNRCSYKLIGLLEEFVNTYGKAKRVTVEEKFKYSINTFIRLLLLKYKNIEHIIYFGDFLNYYPNQELLSKNNIKIHLPSAHYIIRNYSTENIPSHDKQILHSFGDKCFRGYID